jgi:hypothetical protein
MPKKYTPKRKPSFFRFLPSLIVGGVVIVGLILSLLYIKFTQDTRQQAAENTNKATLSLSATRADNDHLKIDVNINTYGYKVAAVDLQGTLVETKPSDVSIEERSTLALNFVQKKVTGDNSNVAFRVVQFASLDPNARTSTNGENITLFSFVVNQPKDGKITVSFDTVGSSIAFRDATNVTVEYPTRQTVGIADAQKDQGIHRSCNEYCADNRECDANFVCYFNRCRNPLNKDNMKCAAPVKKVTTATGVGGPITSVVKVSPSPTIKPTVSPSPKTNPGVIVEVATEVSPEPNSESIPVTPFPSPLLQSSPIVLSSSPMPKVTPKPSATPTVVAPQKTGPNWGLAIFSVVGIIAVVGGLIYFAKRR